MENNHSLVSIIVITYNQEKFIKECVESIIKQTYKNIEIIIADDSSLDDTKNILINLERKYPLKITLLLSKKNEGITKNSNKALKKCRGEFICFTGGDDVFFPNKIERQINWIKNDNNRVMCGHDAEIIDKNSNFVNKKFSNLTKIRSGIGPKKIINYGPPFPSSSMLFRKTNLPKYGFDPIIKFSSDWKLMIDLVYDDKIYGYIDDCLSSYRIHDKNVTKKYRKRIIIEQFIIFFRFITQYKKKYLNEWISYFVSKLKNI